MDTDPVNGDLAPETMCGALAATQRAVLTQAWASGVPESPCVPAPSFDLQVSGPGHGLPDRKSVV